MNDTLRTFISRGVVIPQPEAVWVGKDVAPERIEPGVTLHPGCRLEGASTAIGQGSHIGAEGPAVVKNCQLGRKVSLGSGFFDSSVFLDGSSMGGGAHVRPGCLLEEQASGAHTVGLKQTVLMPYVTLGSLVNFCDCLMAGGTSRKHHSEVGSSYIHFNFTPHQDKATPSLLGDVVHGVLLDQPPIFMGGQGGLVGPTRIAFGTVIPAGQIIRHDVIEPNHLVRGHAAPAGTRPYQVDVYGAIARVVANNLAYIGNIHALRSWYRVIRKPFMANRPVGEACHAGALNVLSAIVDERIKRLDELAGKLKDSVAALSGKTDERSVEHLLQQQTFISRWATVKAGLALPGKADNDHPGLQLLLRAVEQRDHGQEYLEWIAGLSPEVRTGAVQWLESIADAYSKDCTIKG